MVISPTLPQTFHFTVTTIGPPPRCMAMLPEQHVEESILTAWCKAPAITMWPQPSRCGGIAMETGHVGVAKQVVVPEPPGWAACLVQKAASCGQDMVRRARLCTALRKKKPKTSRKILSCQKRSLWLWATCVHIQETKIGAPIVLERKMPMDPSIILTSLTTRTVCHTRDLSQTRTLSFLGLIARPT